MWNVSPRPPPLTLIFFVFFFFKKKKKLIYINTCRALKLIVKKLRKEGAVKKVVTALRKKKKTKCQKDTHDLIEEINLFRLKKTKMLNKFADKDTAVQPRRIKIADALPN